MLSPFAKIKGLYFNNDDEPDSFFYDLTKELKEKCKKNGVEFVSCEFDNPNDYYNMLKALDDYTDEKIKVYATSKEGQYDVVLMEDSDMDDNTKPSYKTAEVGVIDRK